MRSADDAPPISAPRPKAVASQPARADGPWVTSTAITTNSRSSAPIRNECVAMAASTGRIDRHDESSSSSVASVGCASVATEVGLRPAAIPPPATAAIAASAANAANADHPPSVANATAVIAGPTRVETPSSQPTRALAPVSSCGSPTTSGSTVDTAGRVVTTETAARTAAP